jgi:photosystem II stability/assembly factor-like uncharacterized protein
MKSFLAACAILTLSTAPLAAAPHWTPLGPYGGFVDTLTVDPVQPQVLYATSEIQGAFKSADGGATWSLIYAGSANGSVAVDPSRHTTLYLSSFDRVLKSTDGGATWTASSRGLPNAILSVLAVDPAKRNRVYLAADGVWRSLDGGSTWQPARRPLPKGDARHVTVLVTAPRPAGTVYAATGAGVFRSVDGGDSWKPASHGLPPGPVSTLAMAANPQILWASVDRAGIFRSTNGGASWSPAAGQPEGANGVISLAVAPHHPSSAWAGTFQNGIYRTTDAGAHWTPASPRANTRAQALVATDASLYAGVIPDFRDPGGVLASGDGGTTWQPRNAGLIALETFDLTVDPRGSGALWAATGPAGLYRSEAGGLSWDSLLQPPAPDGASFSTWDTHVAFSADGAILYTVFDNRLWASADAGASWQVRATNPGVFFFLVDPVDPATLYTWVAQDLYASHDAGATWQVLKPGLTCSFNVLAVAPSAPGTLYAGGALSNGGPFGCRNTRAALFRSTDGGATWAEADAGLGLGSVTSLAVDPFDPRTVYSQTLGGGGTPDGVWKSTDGGATWLRTGNLTVDKLVFSAGGGTLWAASGSQVFASHDGAASWQPVGGPLAYAIDRLVPDPLDPERLYAATWSGIWVFQ